MPMLPLPLLQMLPLLPLRMLLVVMVQMVVATLEEVRVLVLPVMLPLPKVVLLLSVQRNQHLLKKEALLLRNNTI